jgi:hypothetical protein
VEVAETQAAEIAVVARLLLIPIFIAILVLALQPGWDNYALLSQAHAFSCSHGACSGDRGNYDCTNPDHTSGATA